MPGAGGEKNLDADVTFTLVTASGSPLDLVQEIDCLFRETQAKRNAGTSVGIDIPPDLPPVRRAYELYNVIGVRGECAYRTSYQVIRALRGNVQIYLDDGLGETREIALSNRLTAIYVPPMVWINLHLGRGAECTILDSVGDEAKDRMDDYVAFVSEAYARSKAVDSIN